MAYPRRPRQLSLAVLGLFSVYSVWVAASALWAASTSRVWLETARNFGFLLVFALALVFFTDSQARRAFRYLLVAAAFGLLAASLLRLWTASDIASLFIEDRFSYPVSYPNNAAALYLITFWPLMWLASGPEERAPVRGVALGLATGLLGLTVMTQSRGAVWSLAITLVLMFIVSPARIRLLFYLLVPALLMVYEFPNLNRYWLDGPQTIGGGLGSRTILLGAIIAAFIGMILALLERWVRVSMRMKATFGAIILLACAGGIIYASILVTRSERGPFAWVSQAWRQFTGQTAAPSESGTGTRLIIVSSSGRVGIWKVAWQEFAEAPALGVGADNFVFKYDRLRTTETYKPQQSHSLELQVLGETGFVGGIFAFGGMLLGLGGILWPRCTAGWRGARETWRRRRHPEPNHPESPAEEYRSRLCSARWGEDAISYGWEMALFVGIAYWLIHASVDWLWQMAGIAIPMILLLAAGLAEVDAHAGIMWPRVNRWLWLGKKTAGWNEREVFEISETSSVAKDTEHNDSFFTLRRADLHLAKHKRRERRRARRLRNEAYMRPPGLLSHVFRALLITLAIVVILSAGLPYLSLQYQKSALGIEKTDGVRAAARAAAAHWLQPTDPGPYETQASIYGRAALTALVSDAQDRAGAVLDDLALSIGSLERAISVEPADWSLRFAAGVATINLLVAEDYVAGRYEQINYAQLVPIVPGLGDWSSLSGISPRALPNPGQADGSLAVGTGPRATASHYRNMSRADLRRLAATYLEEARVRNPLAPETAEATKLVESL
ncbi:MAG: O-antigen ligase family protein [Actinobacteria bacterium]|nr:O-antigen ligase family protein [Actinomycetota bacterium]